PFDRYWDEIKGCSVEEVKNKEGENNPLFKLIRQHGLAREFPLIVATLKAFSEGRVRIEDETIVDASGKAIQGYDLTEEIERKL
ncbi:MAG: phosphoglycerate transporter, partial [Chloroflexi bacterium]